jgi:hypothetical protein
MKAQEQKDLLAILSGGDILAAYDYVLKACAASTKAPKPMRVKRTRGKLESLLPAQQALEVAPCRCTVYNDEAVQCREHAASKDPSVCLELIERHLGAINERGRRGGRTPMTHWPAFIYQHASGYNHCPVMA